MYAQPLTQKFGTRRPHEKKRSGCLTCKIRRVKCDEQKPACKRCIKFGIQCDGYNIPRKSRTPAYQRVKAVLAPKTIPIFVRATSPPRAPSANRFESDDELRYFEVFSTSTAYEIFPNVEMGRLRLMFLQTCESKKFIRQAIIALGALDKTGQTSRTEGYPHDATRGYASNTASQHYQYAITHYAQAIKSAQMDKTNDFRIALIISLIILSFEGWVGNHELAIKQIGIGTKLLKEWRERYMETSTAASDDANVLTYVFTRLSIQLQPPSRPPRHQPSAPAELIPLKFELPAIFHRMPKSFSSLDEAGMFYSIIVRFAVNFVSQGLPRIARASSLTGAYASVNSSGVIPPEVTEAQATLSNALHRWMAAFNFLASKRDSQNLEEKKASITLELQMKATYMGTIKSLAQDEMMYDDYYDIHQDIVTLSEDLLKSSNHANAPRFSFDSAVIIPLWFTGHKCRNPTLRRKVIELLLNYPRREGVWDSVFAGLVIDCIRQFEEEYLENGNVPGWARIRITSFNVNLETRTVEIRCQQRVSETSEEVVTRSKTLDYYVHRGGVTLEEVGAVISSKLSVSPVQKSAAEVD